MRDSVISKSAPIGADLDLTISLRSTVRMNKEAPIGADSFCDNERYCQIKIGTNWCLFILTVMRDSVISKSAPIGADLDLTISLRSTVRMNKEAPIGADFLLIGIMRDIECQIKIGTNWCLFIPNCNERYL